METLDNKSDFDWYKRTLNGDGRYEHGHRGEPSEYPCMVISEFWDYYPNSSYTYNHTFYYQQEVVCDKCGSKKMVWSGIDD